LKGEVNMINNGNEALLLDLIPNPNETEMNKTEYDIDADMIFQTRK